MPRPALLHMVALVSTPKPPEPALSAEHGPVLISRLHERNGKPRGTRAFADAQHGVESTYNNWQCRCRPCRRAHAEHTRRKRARARSTNAA